MTRASNAYERMNRINESELINADCRDVLPDVLRQHQDVIIVSDPPFNIGYHYGIYSDRMKEEDYYDMLGTVFGMTPSMVIHYPEALYKLSFQIGKFPLRVVSWVYNSNTAKQHRDIAFFDVNPDFTAVKQPYKNPNDKRIRQRIAAGKGARLYDWWNVNQVKNVSRDKTGHPCQMPLEVMRNIIGILPPHAVIVDPFMGSGTTGVACAELNRPFVGIEIDPKYYEIARERINEVKHSAKNGRLRGRDDCRIIN